MPSGIGASYTSLAENDVYKPTTISDNKFSVIESVKKAFSFAGGVGTPSRRSDPLISREDGDHPQPRVVRTNKEMPTSGSPEEAALLG